ncbi:Site-specific recombinase XerD [Roseivivax marinus]|uniref:tyrosine-type recombinase/integrase n=1 Tax=Roseivivax marinus TaxID=1379903 RepID=UPI0008B49F02|nr:tyrosine-type recombinase/integrase [Roseivivax marinus]SEL87422.1 Site-specific recombinase XerD [Roseivivax marinus]
MKSRKQFPGATAYFDRHGRRRWRFRKGGFTAELGRAYGSDDFVHRYDAAVAGYRTRGMIGAERTKPGSVSALIASYYRSPDFLGLSDSTKRVYKGVIEKFRAEHGDKPAHSMQRRHVQKILAEKSETPAAANNLRKRLITLLDHAISLDWRGDNPARATKPYRVDGTGFHTWDEGEIERFFYVHRTGTLAHRAVTLMLYTGAARVDAVKLGPWNVKAGRIEYRRQKTARSGGVPVSIPMHEDLREVLSKLPDDRPFLATNRGTARTAESFGNYMRQWCDEADLSACTAHGLRKACARRLAEAGATAHEIGAVTGHKTLSEVQRYTADAQREGMADSAFCKLIARPNGERSVTNLTDRFAKTSSNRLKGNDQC